MKLSIVVTAALATLGFAAVAHASPITYNFSAVLAQSFNGSNTVSGTFTLDAAIPQVTDWSFNEPFGTFDSTNSTSSILQLAATSPNANFVGLIFSETGTNNLLRLWFETTLATFDASSFYPGTISSPTLGTFSTLFCAPITPTEACSGTTVNQALFLNPQPTPTPEPASMLLFGSGVGAAFLRLRRRKA